MTTVFLQTVEDVINYANRKIQGDDNIPLDNDGISFFNDAVLDYHWDLIHREVDASEIQEAYRDAVVPPAGEGSTFLYPDDMFALKTMTINYTDQTEQNYVTLGNIKTSNTEENVSFEFLRQNQATDAPLFEDRGDWFEVFPAFTAGDNLTQAIRIFYFLEPTVYTSLSQMMVYPETIDPIILALLMVELYYDSIQQDDRADRFGKKAKDRADRTLLTLTRGQAGPITTNLSTGLTGQEY